MSNPDRFYVECSCSSPEHVLRFSTDIGNSEIIENKINLVIDQSINKFGVLDYEFCFYELLKESSKLKSSIFEECVENRGEIDYEYCFFLLTRKLFY